MSRQKRINRTRVGVRRACKTVLQALDSVFGPAYRSYSRLIDRVNDKVFDIVGEPLLNLLNKRSGSPADSEARKELVLRIRQLEVDIASLSTDTAKERFLELIAATDSRFNVLEASSDDPMLDRLAPELRGLMAQYKEISLPSISGPLIISREYLSKKEIGRGRIWIGEEDGGHTAVFVKREKEAIYQIGDLDDGEEPAFASVYHWLVFAHDLQRIDETDD